MEMLLFFSIVISYFSLSSKISKVKSHLTEITKKKKNYSDLTDLIGKMIELETEDCFEITYGYQIKGILKEFNQTWLVMEVLDKKNKKELYYYRLKVITSINIIEKS